MPEVGEGSSLLYTRRGRRNHNQRRKRDNGYCKVVSPDGNSPCVRVLILMPVGQSGSEEVCSGSVCSAYRRLGRRSEIQYIQERDSGIGR